MVVNSSEVGEQQVDEMQGTVEDESPDYRPVLAVIGKSYAQVHGYVSVTVCVVSILVNLATVVVLTRRQMVSPSNTMLTGIAVTEIIKLVGYVVYAYEFNLVTQISGDVAYSFGWIGYLIVHASLSLVLYAVVTWLTVLLAIFRYIVVCVQQGQQKVTIKVARVTILCVYLLCAIVYIPNYFSLFPVPKYSGDGDEETDPNQNQSASVAKSSDLSSIDDSHVSFNFDGSIDRLGLGSLVGEGSRIGPLVPGRNLSVLVIKNSTHLGFSYDVVPKLFSSMKIIHGPLLKLLASVLITVPTTLLIIKMQQAAKKRIILKGSSRRVLTDEDEEFGSSRRVTFRERISSAANILTTLPDRIGQSARRQSARSPQLSPNMTSPTKRSSRKRLLLSSRSKTDGSIQIPITLGVTSDQQVSMNAACTELHSNNNGETHAHQSEVSAHAPSCTNACSTAENTDCVVHVQLRRTTTASSTPSRSHNGSQRGSQEHHRRTTLLLLAVVMCFVAVEFPHGIMLLIGELSKDFYENVYMQLGDLLDLVTLCCSSLNFVLYCAMSRQFRTTFTETFIAPILRLMPCLTREERLASTGSVRITYARKRSNPKKPCLNAGAVAVSNPKYIAVQPPTQIDEACEDRDVEMADDIRNAGILGGNGAGCGGAGPRAPLLSVNSGCLAIPSQISEISVSAFSGLSNASHVSGASHGSGTSQQSAMSTVSHVSDGSQQSGSSYRSHLSNSTNTTATTFTSTSTDDTN